MEKVLVFQVKNIAPLRGCNPLNCQAALFRGEEPFGDSFGQRFPTFRGCLNPFDMSEPMQELGCIAVCLKFCVFGECIGTGKNLRLSKTMGLLTGNRLPLCRRILKTCRGGSAIDSVCGKSAWWVLAGCLKT